MGFGGGANDFYDAAIAATNLTWTIDFMNSGITNVVLGPLSGVTNGTFTLPASGASATNGSYQVWLRAVDSAGRRPPPIQYPFFRWRPWHLGLELRLPVH